MGTVEGARLTMEELAAIAPDTSHPVLLFQQEDHRVYWLGTAGRTAFRCNTYLIVDGEEGMLVDPGACFAFDEVRKNLLEVLPLNHLRGMILSHQDPDVAASLSTWLDLKPDLRVFATPRTHVLLPHYCHGGYRAVDVEKEDRYVFASGRILRFLPAPFLHFPGALATLDQAAGYLFSGDVWAALDMDWQLLVTDFSYHIEKMDLFHKDYMAGNRAARGFALSLDPAMLNGILPQHGSLIPARFVPQALAYLKSLECGLDLIYPVIGGEELPLPAEADEDGFPAGPANEEEVVVTDDADGDANEPLRAALGQARRLARLHERALRRLRAAEQALRTSEERLLEAQAIASLGHWEWDLASEQMNWSDVVYRLFGLSPDRDRIDYQEFLAIVHPEDRDRVREAVRRAVNWKQPYDIVHRIVRPDGRILTVHGRARLHLDRDDEATRMVGTIQDISDLTRTEERLNRRNRLINAIERMQSAFIADHRDRQGLHQRLLDDLLALTGSSEGFTGSVRADPEGNPFLIVHALTDMSWNAATRKLYETARVKGLEFHDLDNLFGAAILNREVVLSNSPLDDPRSKGIPDGHPRLQSFLGIPVFFGERLVGLIGLANRPGGFDRDTVAYLSPLVTAFGQVLAAGEDQEARRKAEKILEQQARLDGLLGIPNRRYFNEYLNRTLDNSIRRNSPLSLLMIDVDLFKLYNDHYGHLKGDECLVEIARAINEALQRPMDIVARYGGEELACILPRTDGEGALKVAERIQTAIRKRALPHAMSIVADIVTVSIGIATWTPEVPLSREELIREADLNLYRAKRDGRNRIVAGD